MGDNLLGARLAAIRAQRGLSLEEVGRRVAMPFQSISRIERGHRGGHIRTDTLIKLCQALHVSADYLLGLSKQAEP